MKDASTAKPVGLSAVEPQGDTGLLDTAMEAALLVMRSGGSTMAAERSFARILNGCGVQAASSVWRLDFIAASVGTTSLIKAVGPIGVNLTRASEVAVLGERAARGELAGASLKSEVERLRRLPSPYGRGLTVAMAAATAGCFSQIAGGDWGSFGIAAVAAGAGQTLRGLLQTRKVAAAPITLICGLLSALIGAIGLRLGYSQAPAATLIASIIYVVPGLPLINGFVDLISYKHLCVGVERMVNAIFLFVVLAVAVAFAQTLIAL